MFDLKNKLNISSLPEKTVNKLVLGFITALSIGNWFYYFQKGMILLYNDAMSHLNISRRVFDSLTPGFAQIGSVWLPLQHILTLPFIWNDYLWHSGIAGSIVSMASYIISAYVIYLILKLLTAKNSTAILGMLIFALNPNMLYLQAVPMTESLLIAGMVSTIYFLLKWVKTEKINYLIGGSIALF